MILCYRFWRIKKQNVNYGSSFQRCHTLQTILPITVSLYTYFIVVPAYVQDSFSIHCKFYCTAQELLQW